MADDDAISFLSGAQGLRLRTLVWLRWLAILGQTIAVTIVCFGLGFRVPIMLALGVILASALLNVGLALRFPMSHRLSDRLAALLLGADILQLAGLLYLTGGLENPFAILFVAPVLISAMALAPGRTLALGVLAGCAVSALALSHLPLPWYADASIELPHLYRLGIWTAIMLSLAFTGVYAWRIAKEGRDLAQALAATELVLAREQHLSQLDGLAAAAAHELGTPLATITLVAQELDRVVPKDGPMAEDVALLRDEVRRCRGILSKLTTLSQTARRPLGRDVASPSSRGGDQPAARLRRAHRDEARRQGAGTLHEAQPRRHLRARQPPRQCARLCREDRDRRSCVERCLRHRAHQG